MASLNLENEDNEKIAIVTLRHQYTHKILVQLAFEDSIMENIKVKFGLPDYKDLLRYGEIESDNEYKSEKEIKRVRKIRYMGILYYLSMINGKVSSLKQLDCLPYDEDANDIEQMTDDELTDMLMLSDRDRNNNEKAEKVYWMCISEINQRHISV